MWQLENYEASQRRGLDALERKDYRMARFHLLKAAEYLLKAAKVSGPDFQEQRRTQARKLLDLAKQCEERLKNPPRPASPGGGDGTERAGSSGAGGDAQDKHLSDFQPLPPGGLKMSDVVGLDEVKRQVRLKVIYPLERPELFRAYRGTSGGGILLYGPPGTGKTMIARAIASEVEAPFYAVKPSDILGMYVGVSERNIARLFQILREAGRAVVFFDELDALLPSREGGGDSSGVMGRVVPQFLQELQGVATKSDAPGPDGKPRFLLALGATNVPWAIDPAVLRPGRFDELIYIPLPDPPARRLMLERNTRERPLENVDFDVLAQRTEGFSGADIAELCENTAERVLERAIDANQVLPIRQQDFLDALAVARPSVRPEHLTRFEQFATGR